MSCGPGCVSILKPGTGITITGSGTPNDPYIIASEFNSLAAFIRVEDTTSVNLSLTGSGTTDDPLTLRAVSILKLTELADVADPGGGPVVGEVPVWVGAGSAGHWEFQAPPVTPAGSVNVSNGISGTGSVGSPIAVKTSGVWGTAPLDTYGGDSTVGAPIYVDSAGNLRSQPIGSPAWTSITGKPTTFPPSAHTHVAADITDQSNLNAGKVNGVKVSSTSTSSTPPSSPSTGDLWFYPAGS